MITLKKSQIFIFDLIFSGVIILVGFAIIFNYYININDNSSISDLNKNILNGFTNTKINSLNGEEIRMMFVLGKVKNIENTVAQQVAEYTFYNQNDSAKNLTRIFVEDYLDKQMNFNLTIQLEGSSEPEYTLFQKINRKDSLIGDAEIVSVSQRIIFGFNSTDYFGPYIFKVRIWK